MHPHALRWVTRYAHLGRNAHVIDVGGRNINGTVRDLFPSALTYTAVDLVDGPGVDVVSDFLFHQPPETPGLILHLETAEHTPDWREHLAYAAYLLGAGSDGRLIFTAASTGRAPHSAVDGGPLRAGEHYENIDPDVLDSILERMFRHHVVRTSPGVPAALADPHSPGDVYALARA
jgi:hypothetical protein